MLIYYERATSNKRPATFKIQTPFHLTRNRWVEEFMTLKQTCSPEYQGAQGAFKDSMIHWILQFTLLITFRCVLHRCESQEIRCWKFFFISIFRYILWLMFKSEPWEIPIWYYLLFKSHQWVHSVREWRSGSTEVDALKFTNDPSAGSPTETLLRLLLPLNDQVRTTFQQSSSREGS